MQAKTRRLRDFATLLLTVALLSSVAGFALAEETRVGIFKVVSGHVMVKRGVASVPVRVGMSVLSSDTIETGPNGSTGITFEDNSLLSLGPDSALAVERFQFDSTTHEGIFETNLKRGKLAVVSGKIAKQRQDAMKVRTPNAILGVRGTRFVIEAKGS